MADFIAPLAAPRAQTLAEGGIRLTFLDTPTQERGEVAYDYIVETRSSGGQTTAFVWTEDPLEAVGMAGPRPPWAKLASGLRFVPFMVVDNVARWDVGGGDDIQGAPEPGRIDRRHAEAIEDWVRAAGLVK